LSLAFGSLKIVSAKTQNHETITTLAHERRISNKEFNLLNEHDRQVILAGRGNKPNSSGTQGPNNFPVAPSHSHGSRKPVSGVNPYRTPPKFGKAGLGANPAGAGGGGNFKFDDSSPASQKLNEINSEHRSFYSDKKKSADQCELEEEINPVVEIVYRIKDNPALIREAKIAGRDQAAQKSMNHLIDQLSLGNPNPGIGTQHLFKGVYYQKIDERIEILGKSSYQMLVTIPEVFVYNSEQNIWLAEVWIAEELFDYLHPFIFPDFFKEKLTIDKFQVLFEIVKIFSSSNTRKEFNIQEFLHFYPSTLNSKRKKKLKSILYDI
jgi:hypothetical protein